MSEDDDASRYSGREAEITFEPQRRKTDGFNHRALPRVGRLEDACDAGAKVGFVNLLTLIEVNWR